MQSVPQQTGLGLEMSSSAAGPFGASCNEISLSRFLRWQKMYLVRVAGSERLCFRLALVLVDYVVVIAGVWGVVSRGWCGLN